MSFLNYSTREINFKIVYWGPGLSGKTTNIKIIYGKVKDSSKGKLVSLATETHRTAFFDFFPLDLGTLKGYKVRFHIYTVPGQIYYSSMQRLILKGVDGIVFVADSQKNRLEANIESIILMQEWLKEYKIDFDTLPYVLQLNKRDLPSPDIVSRADLITALKKEDEPVVEAIAFKGDGVIETLKAISKLIMIDAKRKLENDGEPESVPKSIEVDEVANNFGYLLDEWTAADIPVEIARQGVYAITNYLKSLREKEKLYEAKLLIVGSGAVGKTSLMKRLIYDSYASNEGLTEGIEINRWCVETKVAKNFSINFWDFGGQEIYHATHQFFLTKRSLYLFVWEARKDDDMLSFDYWLNVIKLLSGGSPVIIILNKIDESIKLIDELAIKNKFKNIEAFFKVSARDSIGTADLKQCICQTIGRLPHIGDTLPKVWIDIREKLEGLKENFIHYSQYKNICLDLDLDADQADFLSGYFHDLGVFLHFQDNPILRDILFLKPEWATNAVYKLVDTKSVRSKGGKFNYHELRTIWDNYPEEKFIYLLELMKRFELCFQLPNSEDYILPELLPPNKQEFDWEYLGNLKFQYHYEFMPAGILTRFIVRNHDLIDKNTYWQNGVVLKRENAKALVMGEKLKRKVEIRVSGEDTKSLLEIIRREFDYIHKSLNDPDVKEMIPCICDKCGDSDDPNLFDFDVLKRYKNKGIIDIRCPNSIENVSVENLVNGIEKNFEELNSSQIEQIFSIGDDSNREIMKIIKIFLASSGHLKDEREKIELEFSRRNSHLISQGVYLELNIWEKASAAFSPEKKQAEFNQMILQSDVFICIIFERLGEFTLEEFNIAFQSFLKGKKPKKIYVYFKNAPIDSAKITKEFQAVLDFKEQIQKNEQFYNEYSNLADLILQVNKNLDMDSLELI